jgi:hypothetical protein
MHGAHAGRGVDIVLATETSGGQQHEKRYIRKVAAQHWLDEQTSSMVTQTWTASERGRISVAAWAEQSPAAQTGLKPSTVYGYRSILKARIVPRWGLSARPASPCRLL